MIAERSSHLLHAASRICQLNLLAHDPQALEYLTEQRGLTGETITRHGLGVWRTELVLGLLAKTNPPPLEWELERAGISPALEDRITIPMRGPTGSYTLGLIGRLLPGVSRPVRYLYPNATQIARRSHLAGVDTILKFMPERNYVALVEGPFDYIACQQIGIPAVCSHGHSFTKSQALMIRAVCPTRLVIVSDGDHDRLPGQGRTGEESLRHSVEKHAASLPRDRRMAVCPLGTDPAQLAIAAPQTLIDLIEAAEPLG